MPWKGTHVIITKHGSPLKGSVGVVKDVLRGQLTASGLKIFVQFTRYNPSAPYQSTNVDYDDVVEEKSVNPNYTSPYLLCLLQGLDFHFWTMRSPEALSSGLQRPI